MTGAVGVVVGDGDGEVVGVSVGEAAGALGSVATHIPTTAAIIMRGV